MEDKMRRYTFGTLGFRAARVAGLACMLTVAATALAHAGNNVGWVWADDPSASSSYTPDTYYSYNSAGGSITITPYGAGEYLVEFGGLYDGSPDNVQVTAYYTTGYCEATSWGGGSGTVDAYVQCYNASGSRANNYFTLLYQSHSSGFGNAKVGQAYIWTNDPTAKSYVPDSEWSYNSTGGMNSVRRHSAGNYTVTLPGLTKTGGNVQVTAYTSLYNEPVPARCKVVEWSSGSSGTKVNVQCYNSGGLPADEYFSLLYSIGVPMAVTEGYAAKGAWAWANNAESTSAYRTDTTYQYNEFETGRLTSQKTGTGVYLVTIPGSLSYAPSLVLVTAYGGGANYCNVDGWSTSQISVNCFNAGGVESDTQFDVTLQTAP
jgi:hypothetical protein